MSTKIKTLATASLVMALALVLIPVAAQAEPHYYKNGTLLGSEPVPVVEWATINFKFMDDPAWICHDVIAGNIENPEGGGAGTGETESFDPYDCESNECPTELGLHAVVVAESLPWPNVLILEGTTVRQRSSGLKVNQECLDGETEVGGGKSVGRSIQPRLIRGTSSLHPSAIECDKFSACELEGEDSNDGIKGALEDKSKVLGYEEQEVISAKTS